MEKPIIYFDNAATTFPKPETVYRAADSFFRQSGNPGRGAHKLALEAARCVFDARNKVASFLGIKQAERLIFTPGCTYSLNMVLKGLCLKEAGKRPFLVDGDTVMVSAFEHNAVMRPLKQLGEWFGIKTAVVTREKSLDSLDLMPEAMDFKRALDDVKPKLCVLSHASNVTGDMSDVAAVAELCAARKIPLVIDAAQTGGRFVDCLSTPGISFWCGSGHKGFMGQPGVGLLYVAPDMDIAPLIAGGTGSASQDAQMPVKYPDHLEPGTAPGPAIASLAAGIDFIEEVGCAKILSHELAVTNRFLEWCARRPAVKVFGRTEPQKLSEDATSMPLRMPVVAFSVDGLSPDVLAQNLDEEANIAIRAGLHCAALAHRTMGTINDGLARVSFGYFNTLDEVDALCAHIDSKIKAVSC